MKKCSKSNIAIVQDYLNGDRPIVQVGYTGKAYTKRKVGETWTDSNGNKWIQKLSGPSIVNEKADLIRSLITQTCKCGQNIKWGTSKDVLFYNKTGLCENCLIDYETKLRIVGVYDDYEKYKVLSNKLGQMLDFKQKIQDTIKYFESDSGDINLLCNSQGFLEKFANTNNTKILSDAKKDLKELNKVIRATIKEHSIAKKTYIKKASEVKLESYVK